MFDIGQTVRTHYEVTGLLETPPYGRWYGAVQSRTAMPVTMWTIGAPFARTRDELQQLLERLVCCYEVRHPNFAPLVDCFIEGDEVVAVLGVTNAPSLAAYVQRRKQEGTPVELGEARIILEHLCGAVAALHNIGLVVGELRPDAVRVTPNGVSVVSIAAGIQASPVELTRALRKAGTARYLAPELQHGGRVGQEADVYSLAALAHVVIYGVPHGWPDGVKRGLFGSMGRWLAQGGWRVRPAERHPAIDEVLRAALSGQPEKRPVNAEALFAMLERAIRNSLLKSVLAAPASTVAGPAPVAQPAPQPTMGGPSPFAGTPPQQKTMLANMSALPLTPVSPPVQLAPSARTMMVDPPAPLAPSQAPAAPAPQLFSMGGGGQLPPTAATMMVDPPAPLAPPRPEPLYASPSSMHRPPEESTMMVEAPVLPTPPTTTPIADVSTAPLPVATPSTPTIAMDARAPVVSDAPRSSLAVDIDLSAFEAVGTEKNKTREVDTKEIAQLLAKDIARDHVPAPLAPPKPSSAAEANKTREVDANEIADLLARTRRDE